ncbi:DUF5700 domain-containing putative Zn-dependent protease [Hymenobacter sp. IS2118]|uniref:DUF5700 domain-containing putative Zn-dependent protease n=1 Tax=Hymenobacter sp. IS2118 TaxID=1505605 RepID=UPI00054D9FD5|nr:DUF5700 domain-containing putative Zn-dependent protease [Hymenobacter sp. IS2118]
MSSFFWRSLVVLVLLLAAGPGRAQTVNVDAATRYWEMTDALRQDKPLTDAAWQDFLEIPGNKIYVRGIYSAADLVRYRKAIEVVYMPRHDSLRQAKLAAKVWYYLMVNDYKEREPEYRTYVASLTQNSVAVDLMYQYAYQQLPPANRTKVAKLNLYYVALGNDATSQQEGIFYSLRAVLDANEVKRGLLEGHEMYHQLQPGREFGSIAPDDEGLLQILVSMQNEGIADQIDKPLTMAQPGDPHGIRDWALTPAPVFIQRMDSAIQARARGGTAATIRWYRRLSNGSNGHLPGFFMSSAIVRNGYNKPMLARSDNPFAFVLLYQKAAKKDKTPLPRFSDTSIRYLKELKRKYIQRQLSMSNYQ